MAVLLAAGLAEILWQRAARMPQRLGVHAWPWLPLAAAGSGGLLALAWVAFKVGALPTAAAS